MASRPLTLLVFFGLGQACAGAPARDDATPRATADPSPPPTASASVEPPVVQPAAPAAPSSDAGAARPEAEDLPPPPPAAERHRPLGACVDPLKHATHASAGPAHGKEADYQPEPMVSEMDLDGDGQDDKLVITNVANITTTYMVYVMRGKCGHFVGKIEAEASLRAVGPYTKGLLALGGLAPCQPQCCERLMYSEFRYDGARFKRAKQEVREVRDCSQGW